MVRTEQGSTIMEYRHLGRSGFKVPVLSLGTGTFGGGNEFFKAWGDTDVQGATRLVDICLDAGLSMFDSADIYSAGAAEEVLGGAIKGRRDKVILSTKGHLPRRRGSERCRLLALPPGPGGGAIAQAPRHRLYRPVPTAWLRRRHPGRGDPDRARRPGTLRQGPLSRRVELLGLAPDEVRSACRSATTCRATSPTRPIIR